MSGFKQADLISTAEPFSKHVDERGVDIVDGLSECRELTRDVGISMDNLVAVVLRGLSVPFLGPFMIGRRT